MAESARRPSHVTAGQNMEMQVRHALPRLLANIGNHAIAFNAALAGHIGDHFEDVGNNAAVALVYLTLF